MKLIILHGAPATGKYTIAKELEKKTGFTLIHIHSLYDFLESVFGKERYETSLAILNRTSLDVFKQSTMVGISGIIYTYAELARDDFRFMKEIIDTLKGDDVQIHLVHLSCDQQSLHDRIDHASRKQFAKTTNSEELNWLLEHKDYDSVFPDLSTLEIDTGTISAIDAAEVITKHYSL